MKLVGTLEACEYCQMSNVQQKKVAKTTDTKSEEPGSRLFVDMSTVPKHKSLGGAKAWLAAVNDATAYPWSHLLKKKLDAPEKIKGQIRKLNDRGTPVHFV